MHFRLPIPTYRQKVVDKPKYIFSRKDAKTPRKSNFILTFAPLRLGARILLSP
jgi:hypothetical protein